MRHNPALKIDSKCSFISYKLRFFVDFCLVLHSHEGFINRFLRMLVQNALTHLVKTHAVGRQVLPDRIYVYLSLTEHQAAAQLERRLAVTEQAPKMTLPPESLIIEILLELIRASRCHADTQTLGKRLRQRGIGIADAEIVYVLTYYDIKKNGP